MSQTAPREPGIDVTANRRARKWSNGELAARILWRLCHPFFAFSPRPLWAWRRLLLRLFGARVGRAVRIAPSARISIPWNISIGDETTIGARAILYALGPMRIGERTTISQGAHLCGGTHDHGRPDFPLVKASIRIGDGVWIAADAFVGPGVEIGDHAIVGARGVAMKNVQPWTVVVGNPARIVSRRTIAETAPAPFPKTQDDELPR